MNAPPNDAVPPSRGGTIKTLLAALIGLLSALYLINPTLGVFELIPDNLPVIGNLDEVTATTLLLSSLAYFGWDLRALFGRRDRVTQEAPRLPSARNSHGE